MKNILIPFEGTKSIVFGSSRVSVRKALGCNYKEFKRNEFAENTTDYYEELGFFIEYSTSNTCEAIEFTSSSNLYYNDEDLFSLDFTTLRNKFDMLSSNIDEEGVGVTYYDLGVGVTKNIESGEVETIIIFSRNYW